MKIAFAALGLALLFIGLIAVVFANIRYYEWGPAKVAGTANNSWSVSANYSSYEGLYVNIVANAKWLEYYDLPDPDSIFQYGYLNLTVDVRDPYGNLTEFEYRWVRWPNAQTPSQYAILPESYQILQNGSLYESKSLKAEHVEPSGVTRYNGTYTATIISMGADAGAIHYPANPPVVMQLVRMIAISSEPYSYALPVGMTSFIGGVAASIYGVWSREHQTKGQKRTVKAKI